MIKWENGHKMSLIGGWENMWKYIYTNINRLRYVLFMCIVGFFGFGLCGCFGSESEGIDEKESLKVSNWIGQTQRVER